MLRRLQGLLGRAGAVGRGATYNRFCSWTILAYLAVQPTEGVGKEQLIRAIWGDDEDFDLERASNRLRVALSRLRTTLRHQVPALQGEVVRLGRDGTCRLNTDVVHSEAHEFLRRSETATSFSRPDAILACRHARALYRGDLLGEAMFEWLHAVDLGGVSLQQQYRREYVKVTLRLARLYTEDGAVERAAALYRSLLRGDPTLQEAALRLVQYHAQHGDRAGLQRDFRALQQHYQAATGDPTPPRAVIAAYQQALLALQRSEGDRAQDGADPDASAEPPRRSIAATA